MTQRLSAPDRTPVAAFAGQWLVAGAGTGWIWVVVGTVGWRLLGRVGA